jgi:hypothetical protein
VTGEVGDADPMRAIKHALAQGRYSGLIISTLPAGLSRWVHMDLPHRALREFGLLVEWFEARTDRADEATISRLEIPTSSKQGLGSHPSRPLMPPGHRSAPD